MIELLVLFGLATLLPLVGLTNSGDDEEIEEPDPIIGSGEGTSGNDLMLGTATGDTILGRGGNDSITGEAGNDTLKGGGGADVMFGGDGEDDLRGGDGADVIWGEANDDMIHGGAGDDDIDGGAGNDTIDGQEGDDVIHGQGGRDVISGGDGADSIIGGDGLDTLMGAAGNDVVIGGAGEDSLSGGDGNDWISGYLDDTPLDNRFATSDVLDQDSLQGGTGDDFLLLGSGDLATGGAGADTFALGTWVDPANAVDITDYAASEDVIVLAYDPAVGAPTVSVQADPDTPADAQVLSNGALVAVVQGAAGSLSADDILLQPLAGQFA